MAKRPSKAERQRRVAQQYLWALVDAETCEVLSAHPTRALARYMLQHNSIGPVVLERVDLRIKGVRA